VDSSGSFAGIARSNWSRRRRVRLFAAVAAAVATMAAIGIAVTLGVTGTKASGDELEPDHAYGWQASKDVGTVFTDGLNVANVAAQARGPLHLISVRPLMDGGPTLKVIGVLARIIPDMLPPGYKVGGFQESNGFPPTFADAAGGVPINGLTVYPPDAGEHRWVEIQIGYEVVAAGRSARRGVELIYEYQGRRYRKVIPSYLAICAPATVACQPEYDK
jgi:hypothetical protein